MSIVHSARPDTEKMHISSEASVWNLDAPFEQFVKDESDITGLLSFSLHKLSVHEWSRNFSSHFLRDPNDDEKNIFMIGEATPRRVADYRLRAEEMLRNQNLREPVSALNSDEHLATFQNEKISSASECLESPWEKGARAALRLPSDTNLKALGKSILILFVLVGLLAIAVNYAKAKFF